MTAQRLTIIHDRSSRADDLSSIHEPAFRTALICDSPLLRSGLEHILQGTSFILAEAASAADPTRLLHPDPEPALVIMEANRSTHGVLQVAKQMKERFPNIRIVALADRFDLGFVLTGHAAGINGFCLAASAPEVLIKSLELVMLGESMVPSALLRSGALDALLDRKHSRQDDVAAESGLSDLKACGLSARETEILECLREGAPNKIIARKLEITEATIKVHVKAILRKIGASNRTQAAMWASQRLPPRGGVSLDV